MSHPTNGRIPAIDVLRGVAVLAVLVTHLPFATGTAPSLSHRLAFVVTDYGATGVHLFLVISGFCIHLPTVRRGTHEDVAFLSFWKRRLVRLYPSYLAAVVLSLAGTVLLRRGEPLFGYASTTQLAVDVISLLLLAQNLTGAGYRVGNGPLWTLALEENLYVLYFALLRLLRRLPWGRVLLIVAAVSLLCRVAAITLDLPVTWVWLGPTRWIEWAIGAFAVDALFTKRRLPAWCSSGWTALASFGIGAVLRLPTLLRVHCPEIVGLVPQGRVVDAMDVLFSDVGFSFAGFVALNWAIARRIGADAPSLGVRFLAWVGYWSYSLYLVHQPALGIAKVVGLRAGLPEPAIYVLRFVVGLIAGYAFHRVVERRFLLRSRVLAAPPASLAPADVQRRERDAAA